MEANRTTAAIQGYLDEIAGLRADAPVEPLVRALLDRSVRRLEQLCAALLHRSYPRLTRPPLNLSTNEMLSAVVERLLKALRNARPGNVRQFFALTHKHMRWELNDLARRLDERRPEAELVEGLVVAPDSGGSGIGPDARRMLQSIDNLPEDEREVFTLVRIQGFSQTEVAELLEVSLKTVQRRLNRSLVLLTTSLSGLRPESKAT